MLFRSMEVRANGGDGVEILVKDNGPGIAEDILDQIFEPFFTTRSGGTGLGLAVVRAVIQSHRGDIQVRSSPGRGTTFVLKLPRLLGDYMLASGGWRGADALGAPSSDKSENAVK